MKESVQKLGRGLALATALAGCGNEKEGEFCEPDTGKINIGTVNAVSGGILQKVSYQLVEEPNCDGDDPLYVVAEADTIGVESRGSGDPLSPNDPNAPGKPFARTEFKAAHRVDVDENGWDVLSFPLVANENLASLRLCLLADNPGETTDSGYQDAVEDLIVTCTKTKDIITE